MSCELPGHPVEMDESLSASQCAMKGELPQTHLSEAVVLQVKVEVSLNGLISPRIDSATSSWLFRTVEQYCFLS